MPLRKNIKESLTRQVMWNIRGLHRKGLAEREEKERVLSSERAHKQVLGHFILDIMDNFLAGKDQQQTNQPNDLAGWLIPKLASHESLVSWLTTIKPIEDNPPHHEKATQVQQQAAEGEWGKRERAGKTAQAVNALPTSVIEKETHWPEDP